MERQLIKYRDSLLFRGIGVTTFGIVALCYPGQKIHALMLPFGLLVAISGLVIVARNIHPLVSRHYREHPLTKKGLGELLVGGAALLLVLLSVEAFWLLLAIWLIITGITNLSRYSEMVDRIPEVKVILITSMLSVLFGIFLLLNMAFQIIVLTYEAAGFAILLGVSLIYTFYQLGKLQQYLGNNPKKKAGENQMTVYYDRAY